MQQEKEPKQQQQQQQELDVEKKPEEVNPNLKKGDFVKRSNIMKNWNIRNVVFNKETLMLQLSHDKKPVKEVDLRKYQVKDVKDLQKKKYHCFKLEAKDMKDKTLRYKEIYLGSEDNKQIEDWQITLQNLNIDPQAQERKKSDQQERKETEMTQKEKGDHSPTGAAAIAADKQQQQQQQQQGMENILNKENLQAIVENPEDVEKQVEQKLEEIKEQEEQKVQEKIQDANQGLQIPIISDMIYDKEKQQQQEQEQEKLNDQQNIQQQGLNDMDDREIAEDDTDIHIHERATFEPKKMHEYFGQFVKNTMMPGKEPINKVNDVEPQIVLHSDSPVKKQNLEDIMMNDQVEEAKEDIQGTMKHVDQDLKDKGMDIVGEQLNKGQENIGEQIEKQQIEKLVQDQL